MNVQCLACGFEKELSDRTETTRPSQFLQAKGFSSIDYDVIPITDECCNAFCPECNHNHMHRVLN